MPKLDIAFAKEVDGSISLVQRAELFHLQDSSNSFRMIHHTQVEYIYELAFLRIFIAWESFLEASFLRYLCGMHSRTNGPAVLVGGVPYYKSLQDAEAAMLTYPYTNYVLWGSSHHALKVATKHLVNSPHEVIISSARTRLENYCAIRNRIAHGQKDACAKFDLAAWALASKTYSGSRAGRFLRDRNRVSTREIRWIVEIATTLKALATSIA
jgi:hypothetical protein